MSNQEAVEIIENGSHDTDLINEALKTAVTALKLGIPMEVTEIHCDEYFCPNCGSENSADEYKVSDKFCRECGQKLLVKADRII